MLKEVGASHPGLEIFGLDPHIHCEGAQLRREPCNVVIANGGGEARVLVRCCAGLPLNQLLAANPKGL